MAKKKIIDVTMRVRIGDSELEVSGPKDFVEAKIADFIGKQKAGIEPTSKKVLLAESGKDKPTSTKGISVAQFFRKLGLRTDVDRTLAAGYYLEKYKNYENFIASDIRDIIRSAKNSPPKNPNAVIDKNIAKGFIMSAGDKEGKRAFVLTSDGEDTVNEMLNI